VLNFVVQLYKIFKIMRVSFFWHTVYNLFRIHVIMFVQVQTFSAEPVTYQELCDGVFLTEVMQQV